MIHDGRTSKLFLAEGHEISHAYEENKCPCGINRNVAFAAYTAGWLEFTMGSEMTCSASLKYLLIRGTRPEHIDRIRSFDGLKDAMSLAIAYVKAGEHGYWCDVALNGRVTAVVRNTKGRTWVQYTDHGEAQDV